MLIMNDVLCKIHLHLLNWMSSSLTIYLQMLESEFHPLFAFIKTLRLNAVLSFIPAAADSECECRPLIYSRWKWCIWMSSSLLFQLQILYLNVVLSELALVLGGIPSAALLPREQSGEIESVVFICLQL